MLDDAKIALVVVSPYKIEVSRSVRPVRRFVRLIGLVGSAGLIGSIGSFHQLTSNESLVSSFVIFYLKMNT